jgi:hypothetical protein
VQELAWVSSSMRSGLHPELLPNYAFKRTAGRDFDVS